MKIIFTAFDTNSQQALEMSINGKRGLQNEGIFDVSKLKAGDDILNVILSSHLDESVIDTLDIHKKAYMDKKIIIFYQDSQEASNLSSKLINMGLIPAPVNSSSLATISLSNAIETLLDIFAQGDDEDIFYGEENPIEIFQPYQFISTILYRASKIEECMLKLVREVWELNTATAIAMTIHTYPNTPIAIFDELLDLLESRIDSNNKLYVIYKRDLSSDEEPYINLLFSRYLPRGSSFQDLISKEDSYLSKASNIIDLFTNGAITASQADMLAIENDIPPKDLEILYTIAYIIPKETSLLIKSLREATDDEQRIDIIVDAIKKGDVDTSILEELALSYSLSIDAIVKKIEEGV